MMLSTNENMLLSFSFNIGMLKTNTTRCSSDTPTEEKSRCSAHYFGSDYEGLETLRSVIDD